MNRILLILILSVVFNAGATSGKFDFSQIRSVFVTGSKSNDKVELIRLYKNGIFEHLVYQTDKHFLTANKVHSGTRFFRLDRNTGTYKLASGELTLTAEKSVFTSPLYKKKLLINNNKVYDNRFRALFKKDEFILKSVSRSKYGQPYFLDPESYRLITNEKNLEDADLEQLTRYLVVGSERPTDKIETIWNFVQNNLLKGKENEVKNDFTSNDAIKILTGEIRENNQQDYAIVFNFLAEHAGIKSKVVKGKLRNTFNSITDHSWNAVNNGNTWEFYDLYLGESWKGIHPELMIHSHFPEFQEDQHINESVTLNEFLESVFILPNGSTKSWINAAPRKGLIDVGNSFTVQYNGYSYPTEIKLTDLLSNTDSKPLVKQYMTGGRITLEIPVNSEKTKVKITTAKGIILEYVLKRTEDKSFREVTSTDLKKTTQPETKSTLFVQPEKVMANTVGQYSAEKTKFLSDLEMIVPLSVAFTKNKLIQEAIKYYGIKEIPGNKHNKEILGFFKLTGNKNFKSDEIAWCSAFLAVCAKNAGLDYTNSPLARSWLNVGLSVEEPVPGDIVIFWREQKDSYLGHVAIWLGETEEGAVCIGGNQDDSVCIRVYDPKMILGYRRLLNR